MAKTATKPTHKPNLPARRQEVQKRPRSDMAELDQMMEEDAGAGLSTDASDNLVPLVYVLQPLSPQAMKKNEAYIDGAEPGMIWLRNSEDPLIESLDFQPCHFDKDWVEWIPRKKGGGFVARYPTRPEAAEQYQDPERPQSTRWRMPNGNDLIETRYYSGIVHLDDKRLPYTIPLSSTGHTVGKDIMFRLNNRMKNGRKVPIYGNVLHLGTKMRSNNAGEWYVLEVQGIDYVDTVEDYQAGKTLAAAFESGEKRAEAPMEQTVAADDDGDM